MKLNEILHDIQGESTYAGFPCSFIRLSGCNLKCKWCDTDHEWSCETDIDKLVSFMRHSIVEITGGEPLMQKGTPELIEALFAKGHVVLIETNGTFSCLSLPQFCHKIIDVKCPSSGEAGKFHEDNYQPMHRTEYKFVIGDREDYKFAKSEILKLKSSYVHHIHFSPVFGVLKPDLLAKWILEDKLDVRLHLQIHKAIKALSGLGYYGPCTSVTGNKVIFWEDMK